MLRLLLPFVLGICTAIFVDASSLLLLPVAGVILLGLFAWGFRIRRTPNYKTRWIFGLLVNIFLFLLGYNILVLKKEVLTVSHFSHFQTDELLATVEDVPREKERSWKLILKVNAVKQGNRFRPTKGLLLTYLAKDSLFRLPQYGDLLMIHGKPMPVPTPANPGTFNYKRYLAHNSIYNQVYLKQKDWRLIRQADGFSVKGWSLRIRAYSMKVLERNHLDGKEFAIAAALLLGQDENLDYETRYEYSSAGVVHILGISGLHVGILYLVLNFIFGFLDKHRKGQYLKLVLVLMMIWFYALITGL
jgi:competence protein ComEC